MNPNDPPAAPRTPAWVWICLTAVTLAAHGLLVLTDHLIWDSVISLRSFAYAEGRDHMLRLFTEVGRPLDYVLYRVLFLLPHPVAAAKVAGVISWGAVGALMFIVLRRAGRLNVGTAGASAILATAAPAFDVLGDVTFWTHEFALTCFWAGWALVVTGGTAGTSRPGWRRGAAMMLLLVSFNLNSLLVFFYAVGLALLVLRLRGGEPLAALRKGLAVARRQIDLLVLPVVFWGVKLRLSASRGNYADYNNPRVDPDRIASGYRSLLQDCLWPEAAKLVGSPWAWVAALLLTAAALWWFHPGRVSTGETIGEDNQAAPGGGQLAMAGLLLLGGATLPYVLVGQKFSDHGWGSRNAILTPLPLALIVVGALCGIARRGGTRAGAIRRGTVVLLAVLCIASCNLGHLSLQGLGAKQEAVARRIRSESAHQHPAVVQLRDHFRIPGTVEVYPPLIWTFLATEQGRAPRTLVFEAIPKAEDPGAFVVSGTTPEEPQWVAVDAATLNKLKDMTTMPYALGGIASSGPQLLLTIRPGRAGTDGASLGLRYLALKWRNPGELPAFLDEVADITSAALPPVASP